MELENLKQTQIFVAPGTRLGIVSFCLEGYNMPFYLTQSPTSNCQQAVLYETLRLLKDYKVDNPDTKEPIKERFRMVGKLAISLKRYVLLIDVLQQTWDIIKSIIPEKSVISFTQYTNTTYSSKMVIVLLKTYELSTMS